MHKSSFHNTTAEYYPYSIVAPRVLFNLGIEKYYSAQLCLSIDATSMDHWVLGYLFIQLIKRDVFLQHFTTTFNNSF